MNEKHLHYFKNLIEGKEVITWKKFWKDNVEELQQTLSRSEFLKLKFEKLDHAEKILEQNGIAFQWTLEGKQQKVWSNLHDSVCDENGKPLLSFRRKSFSGAFGDYLDNKTELSLGKIKKHIDDILKTKDPVAKSDLLNEAEFDAEAFFDEGFEDFAIVILKQISEIATDDNLLFPAINYAKLRLKAD